MLVEQSIRGVYSTNGSVTVKGDIAANSNIEIDDGDLIVEGNVGDNCRIICKGSPSRIEGGCFVSPFGKVTIKGHIGKRLEVDCRETDFEITSDVHIKTTAQTIKLGRGADFGALLSAMQNTGLVPAPAQQAPTPQPYLPSQSEPTASASTPDEAPKGEEVKPNDENEASEDEDSGFVLVYN